MASYRTNAIAQITPMDQEYSYLASPPVSWVILASDMNLDPSTSTQGRHVLGLLQGVLIAKVQDTTLASGRNTGRTFTAISGTWHDDLTEPQAGCYALVMLDSTPGVVWEVTASATTPLGIEAADIVIKRGIPPAADPTARAAGGYYCYVELAHGSPDNLNYRVVLAWGQPISLQFTTDGGATWGTVGTSAPCGLLERYLRANDGIVRLRVVPDVNTGSMVIEIGDEGYLRHAVQPDSLGNPGLLPQAGKIDLSGMNGSVRLNYFPLRSQPVKAAGVIRTARNQPNAGNAFLTSNSLAIPPASQGAQAGAQAGGIIGSIVTADNQTFNWSATGSVPDAGDGFGGSDIAVLANTTMVIPGYWIDSIDGVPDAVGSQDLPNRTVESLQVWDDTTRCFYSSALVDCDNQYGQFTGAIGHRAIDISATNGTQYGNPNPTPMPGGPYFPTFCGIAGMGLEGIDLARLETWGRMGLPCRGREAAMQHAAAQRRLYDGWCVYSAARFECELGNVHPRYLYNIPLYIPPGATSDAPYGEAGPDCPYPTLAKGTGMASRYDFGPTMAPWDVLQILVQEQGYVDPSTLQSLPFYMGFDLQKQFHFEYFDPSSANAVIYYSDIDPTGQGQIINEFHAYNSIAQLRSDVDFQGIDSKTYELLVAHLTMPNAVLKAIGFYYPWLERNARYDSGYIQQMVQVAGQIASQPQQVVKFRAPFQPSVSVGQKCYVQTKDLGGVNEYVIIELRSRYGMQHRTGLSGLRDSYSLVTARSTAEYPRSVN